LDRMSQWTYKNGPRQVTWCETAKSSISRLAPNTTFDLYRGHTSVKIAGLVEIVTIPPFSLKIGRQSQKLGTGRLAILPITGFLS
jgi:hypothetical protein